MGAVELDEVHRFTDKWERAASLRLRVGDPSVLDIYQGQGRIHTGNSDGMEAKILEAWKESRDAGRIVALMANSRETVNRLNNRCQQLLVGTGHLDPARHSIGTGDQILYDGDEVVTRRNDRTLRTTKGLIVKNGDHWTIHRIHDDGTITVAGQTGTVTLPAKYVTGDVELGYAQTSHTSQGRTVDTALLLIDTPTDSRGVYTPMTRGRDANHAYVAIEDNQTGADTLAHALSREWTDVPAVVRRAQLTRDPRLPTLGLDEVPKRADRVAEIIDQRTSTRSRERAILGLDR